MAIWYVDYESGSATGTGTSFANRRKTINGLTIAAGDSVRIKRGSSGTALVGNCTWTNNSSVVTLPTAVTQDVIPYTGGTAWTAATNVTATATATASKGGTTYQMAVAAAFVTGQVAYKALGSTLDLSAYQQLSFWMRSSTTVAAASVFRIDLCSDTVGAVPVASFTVNKPLITARWTAFTLDLGGAMPSNVNSISLVALSDPGTTTVYLTNILACKSFASQNALTLNTLIGKNITGESMYGIQSINGTTVTLDNDTECVAGTQNAYQGSSETVATYKVVPILLGTVGSAASTSLDTTTASGTTAASPILISGGWDSGGMNTQTGGVTWIDGQNGLGYAFVPTGANVKFDKLGVVRCDTGFRFAAGNQFGEVHSNNCTNLGAQGLQSGVSSEVTGATLHTHFNTAGGASFGFMGGEIDNVYSCGNKGLGLVIGSYWTINNTVTSGNVSGMSVAAAGGAVIKQIVSMNNSASGMAVSGNSRIYGLTGSFAGNATSTFALSSDAVVMSRKVSSSDTTLATFAAQATTNTNPRLYQQDADSVAGNHVITSRSCRIATHSGDNRRTLSGLAWEFKVTGTLTAFQAFSMSLAKVAVVAGTPATVSVWAKRTTSTSTINGFLFAKGRQIGGVDDDITVNCTASADTWQQLSYTFTPTETGVIEFEFLVYGTASTTNLLYIDDFSFTQA